MKRVVALAGFFTVAGVVFLALPSKAESVVNEQWMKDHTPDIIHTKDPGILYQFHKSPDDPQVSYKSDKQTYEMLNPFGIVSRRYYNTGRQFDVVLIAGNDKENFHDPHVCFRAQGWTFIEDRVISIPTKTRGTIPATFAVIENRGKKTLSVFFYRGPKGFYPSTPNLGAAMLLGPLMGDFQTDAVFYRFMPEYDGAKEEEIIEFVGQFMDEAGPKSNNYF
ncbi:MAG: exosortase-associated EpsI family protein [Chlorobia bacterium]|nr:exosortase-associated EpsI family protein [Fimbriimonadaceae bacterium]